jgi:hypothetical protein
LEYGGHSVNPEVEVVESKDLLITAYFDSRTVRSLGVVMHACHPSYIRGVGRRWWSQFSLREKIETLSEK